MVVLFEDPHDSPLATFLMQVFITLVVCKFLAKLLSFIRQPQVIGQIITGIIFGPSILGYVPGWSDAIWPKASLPTFQLIANLGLIFFMFFLGLELDLQQIKKSWKITFPVAFFSITIPVGCGCAMALWFYDMNNLDTSKIAFILFVASGFGFSAFPVLATLLNSMNLLSEPIGVQIISIAAVEDIVVWIVLAIASAFSSGGSALQGLYTLLLTLGFIVIMFVIIRPILGRIQAYYMRRNEETNVYLVVICFLLLVVSAFTTEVMGIHAFFGAFISGLCIPRQGELTDFLSIRIELIIVEFFLPLYFANSGLQTRLNLLDNGEYWWKLLILILAASAAKIIPVTLASKACTRKPWYYCLSMGVLMNTRGIVQLVVLNIGVQLGVLSNVIFAMFVLMATILTFITSPVLYLLYRRPADRKKLEGEDTAHELHLVKEGSSINGEIPTISNGENNIPPQRQISSSSMRPSSARISATSMPIHDTFLVFDHRESIPGINYNSEGDELAVLGNLTKMPVCPSKPLKMTRF